MENKLISEYEQACVDFVRTAVARGLALGDAHRTREENGGNTQYGDADVSNTKLAEEMFAGLGLPCLIEENLPSMSQWPVGSPVAFVDPIDGSAEHGTGGLQFSAAVSIYHPDGRPICGAAASPGVRPIFRVERPGKEEGFTFHGFSDEIGALLSGGPAGVFLQPLRNSGHEPLRVPPVTPRLPNANGYTSVALDPNRGAICGLKKGIKGGTDVALSRMAFSNIFSQMQVLLGQTDAATLGPTPSRLIPSRALKGPKAWDFIMPLANLHQGLSYVDSLGNELTTLDRTLFNDKCVLRERVYLVPTGHAEAFVREIIRRFYPIYDEENLPKNWNDRPGKLPI